MPDSIKPRLLVVELWGMGDLLIATPFLQAACRQFEVTLLAKDYAHDLGRRFWPEVHVTAFQAPWTAFRGKYWLHRWPWKQIHRLRKLSRPRFDMGISARWDPRDHFLMWMVGARRRFGFPRLRSQVFLTDPLNRPAAESHRYESWRVLARGLGFELPNREGIPVTQHKSSSGLLIHTGAGQPVRVWPLDRYRRLAQRLRAAGYNVRIACDPDQRSWWKACGEKEVQTPLTVSELMPLVDAAGAVIGNDSGPCHLAAFCGVPTFTLFGPQLPEWFAPLHPRAEWLEGKPCPYKPCSDYCRFDVAYCMTHSSEEEVWTRVTGFLTRVIPQAVPSPANSRMPES